MTKPTSSAEVLKVEKTADSSWVRVTLRAADGTTRVVRMRNGSMFKDRPRPSAHTVTSRS